MRTHPASDGLVLLSRSLLCSSGLFSGCFLRGALLGGRLFRRSLTLRRPLGALFGEQFDGALMGKLFDGFRTRHRNVGNAVGNVRPKPPVFNHDILFAVRVYTKLGERGLSGSAPALFRLRINVERLFKDDREDFFLRPNRPRVGTLLQVRAKPPILHSDFVAFRISTEHARQAQELERIL